MVLELRYWPIELVDIAGLLAITKTDMMGLVLRDNDALDINPPAGDSNLSVGGSDWLWAVTAFFIVSFVRLPISSSGPYSMPLVEPPPSDAGLTISR